MSSLFSTCINKRRLTCGGVDANWFPHFGFNENSELGSHENQNIGWADSRRIPSVGVWATYGNFKPAERSDVRNHHRRSESSASAADRGFHLDGLHGTGSKPSERQGERSSHSRKRRADDQRS